MEIIFASNNKGKIREIKEIFKLHQILSLKDTNISIEVLEDQDTFYGNANKKAKEIQKITNKAVISDDSGICIQALNDWPGVMSHRFLGENKTEQEINEAILKKCESLENKEAKIVCVLVYYDGLKTIVGEGILTGKIVTEPRGKNGFGFDSIFELENGKTLAELSNEEKNIYSARALAALDLKQKLRDL